MAPDKVNPRQLAVDVCFQVLVRGQSLTESLEKVSDKLPDERDQGFCRELCYGFCRYYYVLEADLQPLMKKKLKSRDRDIFIILLLGLYQVRFMRVEDHAAVNESVKLLKKRNKLWARGLVNALLRSYIRQMAAKPEELRNQLSVDEQRLAYPRWMGDKICQQWGEASLQILKAGNQRAPMVLRVNTEAVSVDDYQQKLLQNNIQAQPHPEVAQALLLQSPLSVERLPGFSDATVSVQDASAQLAATLLECQPGMTVLDACAAPGGKTLHLLQSVKELRLTALDKDSERLQRVEQNLNRGSVRARLVCADAAQTDSWFDGELFDRILLDAPCSASGIIRRHPDIRLLRREEDVAALVQQQQRLLQAIWPLLKVGGRLLYSTCSIFQEENEQQVQQFLSHCSNCIERPVTTLQCGVQRAVGLQILSGYHQMDGFFYAVLEKKE